MLLQPNQRMVCVKTGAYGSPVEGEFGIFESGAEYVPGLDAGRWSVKFEQPHTGPREKGSALFAHTCANYWTREEMLESWQPHFELLSTEKPSSAQVELWFDLIASYAGTGRQYALDHEVDPEDGTLLVSVTDDGLTRMARFDRAGVLMGDWL